MPSEPIVNTYETVDAFCKAHHLSPPIPKYITELNDQWTLYSLQDNKHTRRWLRDLWKEGRLEVQGICGWIIEIVKFALDLSPPFFESGAVLVLKNRARKCLMIELQRTYQDLILLNLGQYNRYLAGSLTAKMKLIWALLGYQVNNEKLRLYIEDSIVDAKLLPLLRAKARAEKKQTLPVQLIELNTPQVQTFTGNTQRLPVGYTICEETK